MDTALIEGRAVPDFDKKIAHWLQKQHPKRDDDNFVWKFGIRNRDRQIYRHIQVPGERLHFETIEFLDKSGFFELPVEVAQATGLDYVFCPADW